MLANSRSFYPVVVPSEFAVGLEHLDSDLCWCGPIPSPAITVRRLCCIDESPGTRLLQRKRCFMSFKSGIYFVIFIIFGFVAGLLFLDDLATGAAEAADTPSKREIFLPVSVPERNHLRSIAILPITVEAKIADHVVVKIVGRVVVYDDSRTQRPADYMELYNNTGNLVAVRWFDRYGIERMAVDRGLLEDRDKLEGVLVIVLDGEAV
jgi:hypothetical protein